MTLKNETGQEITLDGTYENSEGEQIVFTQELYERWLASDDNLLLIIEEARY